MLGALGLVIVFFSFGLSWVFTALGLVMRSPNATMNAGFMTIFPLTFLGQRLRRARDAARRALRAVRGGEPDLAPGRQNACRSLMNGHGADSGEIVYVLVASDAADGDLRADHEPPLHDARLAGVGALRAERESRAAEQHRQSSEQGKGDAHGWVRPARLMLNRRDREHASRGRGQPDERDGNSRAAHS